MSSDIVSFFNQISADYDDIIARSVPRYREMFWAMLYYLPTSFAPRSILELGCGTGNLTRLLRERWPQSQLTVVDLSPDMLEKTAQKVGIDQLTQVHAAFEALDFPTNTFDLVISSIAVHHIEDAAKARLIAQIAQWLKPAGFFVLGDQVKGANERLYQADVAFYEAYAQDNGATMDDILSWREHRIQLDHYATLQNLRQWMTTAGLENVDVLWRYCFWAVLQGQKPG